MEINIDIQKNSNDEPRWKDVVNIEEILNKIGPEGCHELAKKLVEVAEDAQELNTLENEIWFEHPDEPFYNTAVVVELDSGKLGIAQLDDNPNRKCWLIQGTGKMFWRSMTHTVKKWRWMLANEIVEYHENKTLKIIEDDEISD